ncbi:uncharacterized protein LOC132692493 [Panthera onca]
MPPSVLRKRSLSPRGAGSCARTERREEGSQEWDQPAWTSHRLYLGYPTRPPPSRVLFPPPVLSSSVRPDGLAVTILFP